MRLSLTVKILLTLLAVQGLLCAQTKIGLPRVGVIDYYGLHKITPERIQRVLATHEGDPFPHSKGDVEERIEKIPGVLRSHLEAVCCDDGKLILFVGIEEKGAAHFSFRSPPSGDVALSGEILDVYHEFLTALESAVRAGNVDDDLSHGHSLMADPAVHALQERFVTIAARQLPLLKDVLRNSSIDEHRAAAAYIIGYAPKKREVVDDLQMAVQDSDDSVRNNAMRSLSALALYASRHPDSEIQISPTWFVEMLNSIYWSDRNKAVMALVNLTDNRPETILNLIRERALPSLVEMARWKSLTHAVGPYTLLGRVAGMTDQQIEDSWTRGDREPTIVKFLKSARK